MATKAPLACRCLLRLKCLTFRQDFAVRNIATQSQLTSTEPAIVQKRLQEILHASDAELLSNITKVEKTATERLDNLDEEDKKRLKVLKLEHQVMIHMGTPGVPDTMKDEWWLQLLSRKSVHGRKKLFRYFNKIEKSELSKLQKRQVRQSMVKPESEERWDSTTKNTIFMFIRNRTMYQFYNSRLVHSIINGPYLVVDISFENHMNHEENTNLYTQLTYAYGVNRRMSVEPFYMLLCNAIKDGHMVRRLAAGQQTSDDKSLMLTVTEKSYLDIFPKERLVYLSPHAHDELGDYNPDDVYIVGGFIDKSSFKPLTLAKAKEQNLRMAKLPLDRYLKWSKGSKYLTVNQVIMILNIWKSTNSWEEALKIVPTRKLADKKISGCYQ